MLSIVLADERKSRWEESEGERGRKVFVSLFGGGRRIGFDDVGGQVGQVGKAGR